MNNNNQLKKGNSINNGIGNTPGGVSGANSTVPSRGGAAGMN